MYTVYLYTWYQVKQCILYYNWCGTPSRSSLAVCAVSPRWFHIPFVRATGPLAGRGSPGDVDLVRARLQSHPVVPVGYARRGRAAPLGFTPLRVTADADVRECTRQSPVTSQ